MDERNSIKQRLLAVLDYDGIPAHKRATHVAAISGLSISTARRMLGVDPANDRRLHRWLFQLANGLDVHWRWLYDGDFESFHPRTFRINIQQVKGYPKEAADQIMHLLVAAYAGHRKADNLIALVNSGQMTLHGAARLM